MEQMLSDEDLHELALDEENVGNNLEDSIDGRNILDLLDEIERSVPVDVDGLVQ